MNVLEYIAKYGYTALQDKKIKIGDSICYVHNNCFTAEQKRFFRDTEMRIKTGRKPHFRLYGGLTPDADLVYWIFPNNEVII